MKLQKGGGPYPQDRSIQESYHGDAYECAPGDRRILLECGSFPVYRSTLCFTGKAAVPGMVRNG